MATLTIIAKKQRFTMGWRMVGHVGSVRAAQFRSGVFGRFGRPGFRSIRFSFDVSSSRHGSCRYRLGTWLTVPVTRHWSPASNWSRGILELLVYC